jgi:hypothetical protein
VSGAELAQISPAGFDERVIGGERGHGDGVGASIADLGFIEMSEAFVHDSEIVERVSQLRMIRPEARVLKLGQLAEESCGAFAITGGRRRFRRFDEQSTVACLDHGCCG